MIRIISSGGHGGANYVPAAVVRRFLDRFDSLRARTQGGLGRTGRQS